MTLAQAAVTVVGVAAVAWELWYFLWSRNTAVAAASHGGVQEVHITVKGGYSPDTVVVRAGKPVRLQFYRDETADCSERIVLEAFGVNRPLPPFQTTSIEFTPDTPGEFPFRCGMAMMKGLLVVEPAGGNPRPAPSPHRHHG